MATDNEQFESVPQDPDERVKNPDSVSGPVGDARSEESAEANSFGRQWTGGPADSPEEANEFGKQWSGGPDNSGESANEFGKQWSGGPDDSAERVEPFGAQWAGDTQGGASD